MRSGPHGGRIGGRVGVETSGKEQPSELTLPLRRHGDARHDRQKLCWSSLWRAAELHRGVRCAVPRSAACKRSGRRRHCVRDRTIPLVDLAEIWELRARAGSQFGSPFVAVVVSIAGQVGAVEVEPTRRSPGCDPQAYRRLAVGPAESAGPRVTDDRQVLLSSTCRSYSGEGDPTCNHDSGDQRQDRLIRWVLICCDTRKELCAAVKV